MGIESLTHDTNTKDTIQFAATIPTDLHNIQEVSNTNGDKNSPLHIGFIEDPPTGKRIVLINSGEDSLIKIEVYSFTTMIKFIGEVPILSPGEKYSGAKSYSGDENLYIKYYTEKDNKRYTFKNYQDMRPALTTS
jgi:hypothetical protein